MHAGGVINSNLEHRNKLGNAFNTTHMYKPTNQERFPCKVFLVFIKKVVRLLSFTFIMSNYSYRLLSRCDKQPFSLATRDHPRPDKDGDRALATEGEKSHVVRLVAAVLYTNSTEDH